LLGYGGASSPILVEELPRRRPGYGPDTKAPVVVEIRVLAGQHRVNKMPGKLAQGDQFPLFIRGKFGNKVPVYIEYLGGQSRGKFNKILLILDIHRFRQGQPQPDADTNGSNYCHYRKRAEKDKTFHYYISKYSTNRPFGKAHALPQK
jgi:hypothetical protein